jgi:mannose-6-phosphate isomerase class I
VSGQVNKREIMDKDKAIKELASRIRDKVDSLNELIVMAERDGVRVEMFCDNNEFDVDKLQISQVKVNRIYKTTQY